MEALIFAGIVLIWPQNIQPEGNVMSSTWQPGTHSPKWVWGPFLIPGGVLPWAPVFSRRNYLMISVLWPLRVQVARWDEKTRGRFTSWKTTSRTFYMENKDRERGHGGEVRGRYPGAAVDLWGNEENLFRKPFHSSTCQALFWPHFV